MGPEAIYGQSDFLVATLCPTLLDPEHCVQSLPPLWPSLGSAIWGEYWQKHICDDIEECSDQTHPPPSLNSNTKVGVPECGDCFGRIGVAQEALGNALTISEIQQFLEDSEFCVNLCIHWPDCLAPCEEDVRTFVPSALPVL